jgi:thioredoxin reductase
LDCELEEGEGFIKVKKSREATVSKVYAVGDVDTDIHYILFAAAMAAVAAISIYIKTTKRCN